MEVVEVKENEDGSADYTFDMTENEVSIMFQNGLTALSNIPEDHCYSQYKEAKDAVTRLGIMDAIAKGIKSAQAG